MIKVYVQIQEKGRPGMTDKEAILPGAPRTGDSLEIDGAAYTVTHVFWNCDESTVTARVQ